MKLQEIKLLIVSVMQYPPSALQAPSPEKAS